MQFITTDQRIAVENFEVGVAYTVAFTSGDSFTGSCMGIGVDFVAFQRTAPEYIFCLTMTTAADVASIEPLSVDIGKILAYTGSVPVSIKTDGTPLLDYLITGSTIQNGTPTPENPIMPQGCGEKTAQLYFKKIVDSSIGADGGILGNASFNCYVAKVEANQQYIGTGYVYAFYTSEPTLGSVSYNGQRTASPVANGFTSPIDGYVVVRHNADVTDAMLNTGSTALPYEPFGVKIPISSANTTTPVYLGEVQTTRKIKKLVLTGEETGWQVTAASGGRNRFTLTITNAINADTANPFSMCTHLPLGVEDATWNTDDIYTIASSKIYMRLTAQYNTLADFKTYLQQQYAAGTPVTVWYVLANEETAVVNEPLMRIGDYADTLSYRQSGVHIPTTDGLNIFDIDTTVKPSEVYLKYFSPLF